MSEMCEHRDHHAGSSAEQQAAQLIDALLQEHPLPSSGAPSQALRPEGVYLLTEEQANALNCIAIVKNGQVIPLIDLEGTPEPRTPGEKMHFMALTARTIMDGLMEALEFWEERRRQHERGSDDEPGGARCHA